MCTTMEVLQSTNGSASEMTTALTSFGNGSYGQGVLKLFNTGYDMGEKKGIIKGSIGGSIATTFVLSTAFFSLYGVVSFVKDCKNKKKNKQYDI